jgi:hypothetical protein
MRSRIMYIEDKSGGLTGPCRIGRVRFSKTGATLHYAGRSFQSLKGAGYKANYFDVETGDYFWISGPRRDGADGLYGRITDADDVDEDVAEAYWREIRGLRPPVRGPASSSRDAETKDGHRTAANLTLHGRKQSRVARIVGRLAADPD